MKLGLALFKVFVGATGSGIEGTLSTFANATELCGAVPLEGRDATQGHWTGLGGDISSLSRIAFQYSHSYFCAVAL